jgi:hypothetical protein
MIAEFAVQEEFWSVLPREFPTVDGATAESWFAELLALYTGVYGDAPEGVTEELLRIVEDARAQILPDDVATLLFRPLAVPVTSIAHIQLFDVGDDDVSALLERALLPTIDFAMAPVVVDFPTEALGRGTKAAFLAVVGEDASNPRAGLSYGFALGGHVVRVFTEPMAPAVLGYLEDPLDQIVLRIRLVDGDLPGLEQLGRLAGEHGESSPL